jgi:hypothetical protein
MGGTSGLVYTRSRGNRGGATARWRCRPTGTMLRVTGRRVGLGQRFTRISRRSGTCSGFRGATLTDSNGSAGFKLTTVTGRGGASCRLATLIYGGTGFSLTAGGGRCWAGTARNLRFATYSTTFWLGCARSPGCLTAWPFLAMLWRVRRRWRLLHVGTMVFSLGAAVLRFVSSGSGGFGSAGRSSLGGGWNAGWRYVVLFILILKENDSAARCLENKHNPDKEPRQNTLLITPTIIQPLDFCPSIYSL